MQTVKPDIAPFVNYGRGMTTNQPKNGQKLENNKPKKTIRRIIREDNNQTKNNTEI